jgi:hypothetical protein
LLTALQPVWLLSQSSGFSALLDALQRGTYSTTDCKTLTQGKEQIRNMATPITLKIGDTTLKAELNESPSAKALLEKLPVTVTLSRWGDEYYGNCGVRGSVDSSAKEIMEVGELAFWPPGSALCIFFGPTPASADNRPRAASPVNPIGRLLDDPAPLKKMAGSITVTVSS